MRLLSLLLILLVCAAGPAVAGSFEDATAAYERRDFSTALRLWRPLADQGHAGAQLRLGRLYYDGHGVAQDYVQAHLWFTLAESQGYAGFPGNAYSQSYRVLVTSRMTPAQRVEAQRLAREWKPTPTR